jgi:hypothetical protein
MVRVGVAITKVSIKSERLLVSSDASVRLYGGETYMYTILLRKLEAKVSGYHRKIYMTKAQVILANTGQALSVILVRASGVMREERGCMLGWIASLARESITRAKT